MDVIPIDALRGAVAARRSWMERTLRDIVAIPSISGSEQAVQAHMRALLAACGWNPEKCPEPAYIRSTSQAPEPEAAQL